MALIMYLTKAPRYQNIITDEYETIPVSDVVLIEKYFNWRRVRSEGGNSGDTLEEWCGIPESKLPHKYVVNHYRDFYTVKTRYSEYAGEIESYGLFEHLARFAKANQIFNWFIKNIMSGQANKEYHEVTKNNLEDLLGACIKVQNTFVEHEGEYSVNEDVAKETLPLMKERGYFFGTDEYGTIYAHQVIEAINVIKRILTTTDFEKEVVYFVATW